MLANHNRGHIHTELIYSSKNSIFNNNGQREANDHEKKIDWYYEPTSRRRKKKLHDKNNVPYRVVCTYVLLCLLLPSGEGTSFRSQDVMEEAPRLHSEDPEKGHPGTGSLGAGVPQRVWVCPSPPSPPAWPPSQSGSVCVRLCRGSVEI